MRRIGRSLVLAALVATACRDGAKTEPVAALKTEISLQEAIALGTEAVGEQDGAWRLTRVHSYDNDSVRSAASGADGRRQWWIVRFAGESGARMDAILCDGAVVAVERADRDACGAPVETERVKLTAARAAERAARLGLRGGDPADEDEWVSGYNFRLECATSAEASDRGTIVLSVIGISPSGNLAYADFDAETGDLLAAGERTEGTGGEVRWTDFRENGSAAFCEEE
ncbi:hypothetical protein [uncultured Alistipes sp.]|uniref:hypothetical protein n=1 Tax=uncultured Alistipes sp. TaxID=538949 RepID=UPI00261AF2F7|nr:hypothetical protein [uncultured Alistipes sp.]